MTTETLSSSEFLTHIEAEITQLAGRMDAQSRLLAKKLHQKGLIYVLFGALDGLSLSYSTTKLIFDLLFTNEHLSTSELMHDWLTTPEGMVITAVLSLEFIVFSILGNCFDDNDKNAIKSFIAIAWPYFRDTIKALKNAYKGFRSLIGIVESLGGLELNHLLVPVGLSLGILSVFNRLWMRWMIEQRKEMMKTNAALLDQIQNSHDLRVEKVNELLKGIQRQTTTVRILAFASAVYSGTVDGLYLYMGVFTLCSLAPPALIAMMVFSSIYALFCIATRVYEEYDYQQKLIISQLKIELAAEGKKIELLFEQLQMLSEELAENPEKDNPFSHKKLLVLFKTAVINYKNNQKKLREASSSSYVLAFLSGAKTGLAAYGALASILFVIGMATTSFPPALLIFTIIVGFALFIGFIIHSLYTHYQFRLKNEEKVEEQSVLDIEKMKINDIGELFKDTRKQVKELTPEQVKIAIIEGMKLDSSPQFFFQEWFEVVRSTSSGTSKGVKAVSFIFNPLEDKENHDHNHGSLITIGLMVVFSFVHSLIFAFRAHARGFGRPPIDAVAQQVDDEIEMKTITTKTAEEDCDEEEFQSDGDFVFSKYSESGSSSFFMGQQKKSFKTRSTYQDKPINNEEEFNLVYTTAGSDSDHYTF